MVFQHTLDFLIHKPFNIEEDKTSFIKYQGNHPNESIRQFYLANYYSYNKDENLSKHFSIRYNLVPKFLHTLDLFPPYIYVEYTPT